MDFDRYVAAGKRFVQEVAEELGDPADLDRGGRVLRCVLQVLRDRLPPQESLDLVAQLPLLIKGLYVEGWKISGTPDKSIRSVDDFFEEMVIRDHRAAGLDFPDGEKAESAARAVFRVLQRHVGSGETADVAGRLPRELRELWQTS